MGGSIGHRASLEGGRTAADAAMRAAEAAVPAAAAEPETMPAPFVKRVPWGKASHETPKSQCISPPQCFYCLCCIKCTSIYSHRHCPLETLPGALHLAIRWSSGHILRTLSLQAAALVALWEAFLYIFALQLLKARHGR